METRTGESALSLRGRILEGYKFLAVILGTIALISIVTTLVWLPFAADPEPLGAHAKRIFSSDYGGTVEISKDRFIDGCIWESGPDGEPSCHARWLYVGHLHRYYVPPSERAYPEDLMLGACVFVEKDGTCTCEPMWYEKY